MLVVSDTSPLSCLASIQRLDLLAEQFGVVHVPPAVKIEAMRHPDPLARVSLEEGFRKDWIVEDSTTELLPLVVFLKRTLDQGESEAISLAVNRHAKFLLIDEREGRATARGLGIRLTGTLGILMRAKLDGSLHSLGEILEKLRANYAFSLAPDLVKRALHEVGEA